MAFNVKIYTQNYQQQIELFSKLPLHTVKGPIIIQIDKSVEFTCIQKIEDLARFLLLKTNLNFNIQK